MITWNSNGLSHLTDAQRESVIKNGERDFPIGSLRRGDDSDGIWLDFASGERPSLVGHAMSGLEGVAHDAIEEGRVDDVEKLRAEIDELERRAAYLKAVQEERVMEARTRANAELAARARDEKTKEDDLERAHRMSVANAAIVDEKVVTTKVTIDDEGNTTREVLDERPRE